MRKLALVSLMLLLGVVFLFTDLKPTQAGGTIVPATSDPAACQADRKNREKCKTWFELTEAPDPTACLYVRRNRNEETTLGCGRWYHVAEAKRAPKVEAKKIVIDQMVHFDFNKYNIKPDSYGILDDVASVLQKNAKINKVRVEGHTDAIGSEAYNMKLSQKRADSVKDYLVKKGIDGSRLESVGYGKTRPIADNKTEAGRAQNRRTEFNVVEQ